MKQLAFIVSLLAVAAGMFGCQTLHYEYTTSAGEKISASSRSCLWDEEIDGFEYDHRLGLLKIKTRKSGSDEKAIESLTETIKDLAGKVATGAAL